MKSLGTSGRRLAGCPPCPRHAAIFIAPAETADSTFKGNCALCTRALSTKLDCRGISSNQRRPNICKCPVVMLDLSQNYQKTTSLITIVPQTGMAKFKSKHQISIMSQSASCPRQNFSFTDTTWCVRLEREERI